MKEKKISSNGVIAFRHSFVSVILTGIWIKILSIVFAVLCSLFIIVFKLHVVGLVLTEILAAFLFIAYPIITYFVAKFSTKILNKIYIIKDVKNITLLSTCFVTIVSIIYLTLLFNQPNKTAGLLGILYMILAIVSFYLTTKKYLKEDSIS
jgi:hypothetical protein